MRKPRLATRELSSAIIDTKVTVTNEINGANGEIKSTIDALRVQMVATTVAMKVSPATANCVQWAERWSEWGC